MLESYFRILNADQVIHFVFYFITFVLYCIVLHCIVALYCVILYMRIM